MSETKLETVPQDARFHNQNVTNWCFETFVHHRKCINLLNGKEEGCSHLEKIYKTICPNDWIKRWEEQIERGTFPVDLPPSTNDCEILKQQKKAKKKDLGRYSSM